MSYNDPIADMLTRIRNAVRVNYKQVIIRASRVCEGIAIVLKDEGYIVDYDRIEDGKGKKTFRQYHTVDDKAVYNMDGVTRVLYRLDKIIDKEQVFICEGEKCVAGLVRLGYDATTNCGGSNNYKDAYAESLRDKDIVIMPDNDDAGFSGMIAYLNR